MLREVLLRASRWIALQAQLVVWLSRLLEVEAAGLGQQETVFAFAVGVIGVPAAERQAQIEHRVTRGFLVIADRIVAAAQQGWSARPSQLSQSGARTHCCSPVLRWPPLWRDRPTAPVSAGCFDQHFAASHFLAGGQLHLRLVRWQAGSVGRPSARSRRLSKSAWFAWEAHKQLAIGDTAALGALHAFRRPSTTCFEVAAGEVLLRRVGATGDQTFGQVVVGDDREQIIELQYTNAPADVGNEQTITLAFGRRCRRQVKFDGVDGEAAGVRQCRQFGRRGGFAGQVSRFFEAALLLFEQAIPANDHGSDQ